MRRRLGFLLVFSSAVAGCSLLVEFDRGKLGSLDALDASDGSAADGTTDAPAADGSGDVTVVDSPVDSPADAPADSPTDAPTDARTDGGDAGSDAPADAPADVAQDVAPDSPVDAGSDAAADAPDDSPADAGLSAHCTQNEFDTNDQTAQATVTVSFPEDSTIAQYAPNCIKVKVGAVVTFHGAFGLHPLTNAGGSAGNPIPATSSAANDGGSVGDVDVTFSSAGTYDFQCGNHPSQMNGGIQVVP